MSVIISNIDTREDGTLTINPTSKSARIAPFDSSGVELATVANNYPNFGGDFLAPLEIRATAANATTVVPIVVVGCSNGTRTLVRLLRGNVTFDGTGLTASGNMRFGLYRGRGYQGSLGGTVFRSNPNKIFSDKGASSTYVREVLAGTTLTVTDVLLEADAFHVFAVPAMETQIAAVTTVGDRGCSVEIDLDMRAQPIILGPGEVLALKVQTVANIIGIGFYGSIEWREA